MKKLVLLTCMLLISVSVTLAQIIDIDYYTKEEAESEREEEEEVVDVLGQSFLDVFSNGKVQGTAQVLRINIGERSGFYIPFYLFVGASGDGFGESERNENTASNLLNPIGGVLNGSFNGITNLYKSESGKTSLKFAYQLSGRLVNGRDSLNVESKFLASGYANAGLFFQTSTWEPDQPDNPGVFWVQAKATSSFGINRESLVELFGAEIEDNYFLGYSVDAGLEIINRINIKVGLYQYLNNQNVSLFTEPVFKLSVDYKLNRN